jgi:hypothetical protein
MLWMISLYEMILAISNIPNTLQMLYCPRDPTIVRIVRKRVNPNPSERRNLNAVSSLSKLGTKRRIAFFPRLYVIKLKIAGSISSPNILKNSTNPPFAPPISQKYIKQRTNKCRRV